MATAVPESAAFIHFIQYVRSWPIGVPSLAPSPSRRPCADRPPELSEHPPELPYHIVCRAASGTAGTPSGTAISHPPPFSLRNCP
jgi:hypothetical protein